MVLGFLRVYILRTPQPQTRTVSSERFGLIIPKVVLSNSRIHTNPFKSLNNLEYMPTCQSHVNLLVAFDLVYLFGVKESN